MTAPVSNLGERFAATTGLEHTLGLSNKEEYDNITRYTTRTVQMMSVSVFFGAQAVFAIPACKPSCILQIFAFNDCRFSEVSPHLVPGCRLQEVCSGATSFDVATT